MLGFYYKILEDKIDKVDKINRANSVLNYFNVYNEDSTHIPEEFRNFYGLYLERVMSDHYKYKQDMGMSPMYTYIKLVGGLIPNWWKGGFKRRRCKWNKLQQSV